MFWVLESTKERCDQQTAAAVLPASYFVSGRKASVGNEVTEYAKKDMEKNRVFFHQPVLPVLTQKWEEGMNEGKGAEAWRKDSVFTPSRLSHTSQ